MVLAFAVLVTMSVDSDAAVGAAANQLTHSRAAVYSTGEVLIAEWNSVGRGSIRLWNENKIAPGVSRDRMRPGRLWDGLNKNAGWIDNA